MEIKVLEKAIALLEAIASHKGSPVPPGELQREISGISQPTCVRLLKTLTELGCLEQVSRLQGYRIGPLTHYLCDIPYRPDIIEHARPAMLRYIKKTGCSLLLATRHADFRVILTSITAENGYKIRDNPIRNFDLFLASTGRMLLAMASASERKSIVEKHGLPNYSPWPTPMNKTVFDTELSRILQERQIISYHHGRGSAAVPVETAEKIPLVLGSIWRENEKVRETEIMKLLHEAADEIGAELSPGITG